MAERRMTGSEYRSLGGMAVGALGLIVLLASPAAFAQDELVNPLFDQTQSDEYGHQVALGVGSGGENIAFVSDYLNDAVHWFWDSGGSWTDVVSFIGDGNSERFGEQLALRSGVSAWNGGWALAMGDSLDKTSFTAQGKVWVASSTMTSQFFPLDAGQSTGDRLGADLAFSGEDLIVSAPGDDSNGSNAGLLNVYTPTFNGSGLNWTGPNTISTSTLGGESLGLVLAANEDWVFASLVDNVNGGSEVVVIERASGGGFQLYGPQPTIPITTGIFGGHVVSLDVEGDLLTVGESTSSVGRLHEYRWHAPTALWQHVKTTNFTDFPNWLATEEELRIGVGDVSVGSLCGVVPLRTWQRLGGDWAATALDPSPDAVGAGAVDNHGRRFVMGSIGGTSCQIGGLQQGTAYYFDFTNDRDIDGTDDGTQIAQDPCADRDANGVLDSTEGLIDGWVNENGGSYTDVFDTGTSRWNWSDGSPDGKLVQMLHKGSSPATVTLSDTSAPHDVLGLTVAGNDSAGAELQLRLAPNTRIDAAAASTCVADVIIEADGRITIDDAGLTAPRFDVRPGGVLEILGSNGHADAVTLADLLPGSRIEMGGGALNAVSVIIGEDGGLPESGGEVIGFGIIPGLVLEVEESGLLHANQIGGGATLTVQGISFKHEGRVDVGELDTLRVETSDLLFAGKTVVEDNGTFDLAYTSFFSSPAEHTGEAELRGGAIRVLDSTLAVLLNTASGKIHGHGEILGELQNEGRIETTVAGGLEALGLTDQTGEILIEGPGEFTSESIVNDGVVQVTGGGKVVAASGDYVNSDVTYVEASTVEVAGDTLNTTSLDDTGQLCLLGSSTWGSATSGTFTNGAGAQMEVADSTVNATSFTNDGDAIFSGATFVNTPAATGVLSNTGLMCVTSGTLIMSGSTWTNTGTVCIETGAVAFAANSLLLPGGGVSWNCPCSLMSDCSSSPLGGAAGDAELIVVGDLSAGANARLDLDTGKLVLLGNFDVAIDDPARRSLQRGTIEMTGSTQDLEVLGRDFGASGPFGGNAKGQIGTLRIGPAPTTVQLVDHHANDGGGTEVLYARDLILESGTTLDLAGRTLYYETIQQAADATVTDSVGGGQLLQSQPPFAGPPGASRGKAGKK